MSKIRSTFGFLKSTKVRILILILMCTGSLVGFLLLNGSRFISFSKMITDWGTDYYSDTTKIIFFASLLSAVATAFSAATIQNLNGNPIASGSTLGIGAAATFGFVLANFFHIYDYYFIMVIMLAASIIPVTINYLLLRMGKGEKSNAILVGLAISTLLGVINYILKKIMGSTKPMSLFVSNTGDLSWDKWPYCVPLFVVGIFILVINFKKISVISYSKELAEKQNINFDKVFFWVSIGNLMVIVSLVFFSGEVGFLGIVGTNLVRMLLKGSSIWKLSIASTAFNLIIMFVAQVLLAYKGINISLTTVIMAVPVFFYVIFGKRSYG